jgi:hypothetical protein
VKRNNEGKLQFIQYTFAGFFVAEFLIKHLSQETKQNTQVQVILLNKDLLQGDCRVIRAFLDGLLEKKVRHQNVFKKIMEKNSVNGGMSQKYIDPWMVSQQQYTQ